MFENHAILEFNLGHQAKILLSTLVERIEVRGEY